MGPHCHCEIVEISADENVQTRHVCAHRTRFRWLPQQIDNHVVNCWAKHQKCRSFHFLPGLSIGASAIRFTEEGTVSSFANDFNYDFHVTLDEAHGAAECNYQQAAALKQAGKIWIEKGELPGLSVFLRDGDDIFHTYSTYQRGLDLFLNTFNFLDVTPLGRQEERPMTWVRHHDKYGAHAAAVPTTTRR